MIGHFEYKGHEGRCEWDEEVKAFYGEVVSIRKDVVTFQGGNIEDAEREFRASVDDYLEMCAEEELKEITPSRQEFMAIAEKSERPGSFVDDPEERPW